MAIDLRLPNIDETKSEKEQLKQVKSYLFQMAEYLQWALKNADTSSNPVVVTPVARSMIAPTSNGSGSLSPEATFDSIKALIIKSADIVNAYSEEINKKLSGEYIAQSDFGMFEEQTSQDIFENSTAINRAFSHVQEIKSGVDSSIDALSGAIGDVETKVSDVEANILNEVQALQKELIALNFSLVEVTANIHSGLLYYDDKGVPVYGLEIGQKNVIDGVEAFNKFARFTASGLTFYDQNGHEVAYISDYKLYITHAEITGTLKHGGIVSSVLMSGDVVEKWVGRG